MNEKLKKLIEEYEREIKDYNPNDPYEHGKAIGIGQVLYYLRKIVDELR